jgi:hypothetical protein
MKGDFLKISQLQTQKLQMDIWVGVPVLSSMFKTDFETEKPLSPKILTV